MTTKDEKIEELQDDLLRTQSWIKWSEKDV
jgi:hypothetical protein